MATVVLNAPDDIPTWDLKCKRGDDFFFTFSRRRKNPKVNGAPLPFDMTGMTISGQVRNNRKATAILIASFHVTVVSITAADFSLSLIASETRALDPGCYVYDVQVDAPAITTFLQGDFDVSQDITHA